MVTQSSSRAEWESDGVLKQRWLIDVDRHISANLIVAIPAGLKTDGRRPAILCWHGHGRFGKDSAMENASIPSSLTPLFSSSSNSRVNIDGEQAGRPLSL